jgi:hypothetical protein
LAVKERLFGHLAKFSFSFKSAVLSIERGKLKLWSSSCSQAKEWLLKLGFNKWKMITRFQI